MKVPISWLRDYVDFECSPQELAERLTLSGTEVGGISVSGADTSGVVVGEILDVRPHPDSDRLVLCSVQDGTKTCQVVCGARNMGVGDKVPLAGLGAVLPGGLKIEKRDIRGVPSEGMLCAEDELGISSDHSGIMILDPALAAGTPFSEVAGPREEVLETEITWNRQDCLSIIGIAREVAALCGSRLRLPDVSLPAAAAAAGIQVDIEDPAGCPRYTARLLKDVRLSPSPPWMQRRLRLCGVRPINNVVDVTNYVMIECGQPLHAFDHTLLEEGRIVVRRAAAGEQMATLDGKERPITPDMLVIADAHRPVALAGIMGGAGSEIVDTTRAVLLESACFDPALIKHTSTRLGLTTESSHRFERGVDIGSVEWASRRAAGLMVELSGATLSGDVTDVYPGEAPTCRITCRYERLNALLGIPIPPEDVTAILEGLQIPVVERDSEHCVVSIPTFRRDMEIEADVIEEVVRIHGLEDLPSSVPSGRIDPTADDSRPRAVSQCRSRLVGLGLTEIVNYSFLSAGLLDSVFGGEVTDKVLLPNPVSADYGALRNSLLPQMIETLGRNLARQVDRVALFEIGKVFRVGAGGRVHEEDRLCIGLMGPVGRAGTDLRKPVSGEEAFLWLRGILEALLAAQHVVNVRVKPCASPVLDDGWAVSMELGEGAAGMLGLVRRELRDQWRMRQSVAVAELPLEPLLKGAFALPRGRSVPAYPSVSRDISMFVDEGVRHEQIVETIRRAAPKELTSIERFDSFKLDLEGRSRHSVAYSLVYRSPERTLTDEEANAFHDTIKEALCREMKAEIRD